jgi:hypothetical protein
MLTLILAKKSSKLKKQDFAVGKEQLMRKLRKAIDGEKSIK